MAPDDVMVYAGMAIVPAVTSTSLLALRAVHRKSISVLSACVVFIITLLSGMGLSFAFVWRFSDLLHGDGALAIVAAPLTGAILTVPVALIFVGVLLAIVSRRDHSSAKGFMSPYLARSVYAARQEGVEMSGVQSRAWLCELDEVEARLETKSEVIAWLSEVSTRPKGRIDVVVDVGPSKRWLRFIGGAKRELSPQFSLEWASDFASLIFHDDAGSEYRAIDKANPVSAPENVRKQVAHGEAQAHPADECLAKTRAFQAVREQVEFGVRPDWLSYRYVP